MALSKTTAEGILKERYLPVVREQLNSKTMLLNQIERSSRNVEGLEVVQSLHIGRNPGIGARKELEQLPDPGNQSYVKSRTDLKYNYARSAVSGPLMKATRTDVGSWVRAVASEQRGMVTDLRNDVNRQLFGTSDGVIAQLADTASSTTVTLHADATTVQARQIHEGMKVDIGTVANPTLKAQGRTVTSVNVAAKTFVISGSAIDAAATDFVFVSGNGGSGADQREITGLQTIIGNTGTLHGVDSSTYSAWKSTVDDNSGTPRAATEGLFQTVLDEIDAVSGGEDVDLIVTSSGVMRNFYNQLASRRQIVNENRIQGGFKAVSIVTTRGETNFVQDKDCPQGTAFLLDTDHLTFNEASDWEFMDDDGSILSRLANTDAYEFTLYKYAELTTDMRNAHGIILDLEES